MHYKEGEKTVREERKHVAAGVQHLAAIGHIAPGNTACVMRQSVAVLQER